MMACETDETECIQAMMQERGYNVSVEEAGRINTTMRLRRRSHYAGEI